MSGGEGKKLSHQDIQLVQNRVEQCLQLYMDKKEIINILTIHDNIEPRFTELVWQRLEEENPEFFKAYYLKLLVKDQIVEFNRLLSEHVELMHHIELSGVPICTSNVTYLSSTATDIPTSSTVPYTRHLTTDADMQLELFHICESPIESNVQGAFDGFCHDREFDATTNLLMPQNSNEGLLQTMNKKVVKAEPGYDGSSLLGFIPPSYLVDPRHLIGDALVSSFSGRESNARHIHDMILDGDTSSFGPSPQIPQTFDLLEVATDFNYLLESFCRPPSLENVTNNFVEPHGSVKRLEAASESLTYPYFGGN